MNIYLTIFQKKISFLHIFLDNLSTLKLFIQLQYRVPYRIYMLYKPNNRTVDTA